MTEEEKLGVVLVVVDAEQVQQAFSRIDFDKVSVLAVVIDNDEVGDNRVVIYEGDEYRRFPYFGIGRVLNRIGTEKDFIWLVCAPRNDITDLNKVKKYLTSQGVTADNILNFEVFGEDDFTWVGNLRFAEKYPVDFFVTGTNYAQIGFDLKKFLPFKGVNLACAGQDLRQSFFTAKQIFSYAATSPIKFVLIELPPYIFRYDAEKSFSACAQSFKYAKTLKDYQPETFNTKILHPLMPDSSREIFAEVTDKQADTNFDEMREAENKSVQPADLIEWQECLRTLNKKLRPDTLEQNLQIFDAYLRLCIGNGAIPICVTLPLAPVLRDKLNEDMLTDFRNRVAQFERKYKFKHIDLLDMPLDYKNFSTLTCLNGVGVEAVNAELKRRLDELKILSTAEKKNSPRIFSFGSNANADAEARKFSLS